MAQALLCVFLDGEVTPVCWTFSTGSKPRSACGSFVNPSPLGHGVPARIPGVLVNSGFHRL